MVGFVFAEHQAPASTGGPVGVMARLVGLLEGQRKVGPFVLLRQLGRGGFAPVWLAVEEYGGVQLRHVALKLFAMQPDEAGARLGRESRAIVEEARALCQVEHPNVVRFYSMALDEQQGILALAMEYLPGRPLDQALKERGRLAVPEAMTVAISVATALAALHRNGVVHRDVKPANIVAIPNGYKLIDFGLASHDDSAAAHAVHESDDVPIAQRVETALRLRATEKLSRTPKLLELCGTIGYIDPECIARSAPASVQSDLYALGSTLFELTTGKLPAQLDDRLLGSVLDGRSGPPAVASLCPSMPRAFGELIDGLLQPLRARRPDSAEWVAGRMVQIRGAALNAPQPQARAETPAGLWERDAAARRELSVVNDSSLARLSPIRRYGLPDPPLPNGRQSLPRR